MNSIVNQMDNIARNKCLHGTVIDVAGCRQVGKTFSLEKIAAYHDYQIVRRSKTCSTDILLSEIRGKEGKFVIDEGYTLYEIREAYVHNDIVLALWDRKYEMKIVMLQTSEENYTHKKSGGNE